VDQSNRQSLGYCRPIYSLLDGFDTGFSPTSSSELRVKLKSRQSLMQAAGAVNVNFTASDVVTNICGGSSAQLLARFVHAHLTNNHVRL
jgi:hypothetical protein